MTSPIRIGTRKSPLALWQARQVQSHLSQINIHSVLVEITSDGDANQRTPLYAMGITGVFTKSLDVALLENRIDIAVHSMKDVPTALCKGVKQAAVLKRGPAEDMLIALNDRNWDDGAVVATGSLRRSAQWKNRYPHHQIVELRGNVQTRLDRLKSPETDGIILAAAGIERLGIKPPFSQKLHWMVPAPAQGAIVVLCRAEDESLLESCQSFNHRPTQICTAVERQFLSTLEGGCTAPIGAFATVEESRINFQGVLLSIDGKLKLTIDDSCSIDFADTFGKTCAEAILKQGGQELMASIKAQMS
jgi:hydroxymethylbilane synthase